MRQLYSIGIGSKSLFILSMQIYYQFSQRCNYKQVIIFEFHMQTDRHTFYNVVSFKSQ